MRNRYEAAAVRQALAFRGIAGVFTRSDSIYHSSEAGELLTFLQESPPETIRAGS
ncbi:MAG: hypothetical protein L6W00_19570 [Lentisphaeria bacterium]|nr:MAG: hypothetical protein L6W00_19570 [Lentisphaeria bacterium]